MKEELKKIMNINQFKQVLGAINALNITHSIKKVGKTSIEYLNDFGTYDSEVTTIVTDRHYDDTEEREIIEAKGLPYKWMVCLFHDYVIFGDYLNEFNELSELLVATFHLNYKRRLVMYCHNLEYDAQFLLGYINKPQIFATDERAILYMFFNNGIEMRCSYKLSNMSLAKFTEAMDVEHKKQSGEEFDYDKIRVPGDVQTELEQYYEYCDVVGLYEAVKVKLDMEHDTIASIPLTSTGYVRRMMRAACRKNPDNRKWFEECALDAHLYTLARKAFRGGNTHANRRKSFDINRRVFSYDVSSSYPSRLLYCDSYPIEGFRKAEVETIEDFETFANTHDNMCLLMKVTFDNIMTTNPMPYIPIDKCIDLDLKHAIGDNGRVLAADKLTTVIMGQDLDIILSMYKFTDIHFDEFYYARTGKLPKEIREVIAKFFKDKSKLKGVEGEEYFYSKAKNLLNSTYGLFVTDPVRPWVKWRKGEWEKQADSEVDIAGQLEKFNASFNSFLPYIVGVVCTAEARLLLQKAIDICNEYGEIIYVDTDSVKFLDPKGEVAKHLDELNKSAYAAAANSDVDCIGYTKDGDKQIMGVFENETKKYKGGYYQKFRTYGAKKYSVEYDKKNKEGEWEHHFEITVSGLSKEKGAAAIGCIENFLTDIIIDDSGRTRAIYDDDIEPHYVEVNGKQYEIRGNIAIVPTTYKLGVTPDYWKISKNEYEF